MRVACIPVRLLSVAVRAPDFTLLYLVHDSVQRHVAAGYFAYIKVLVCGGVMVELQHNRVTLAAVHAVVDTQVVQ